MAIGRTGLPHQIIASQLCDCGIKAADLGSSLKDEERTSILRSDVSLFRFPNSEFFLLIPPPLFILSLMKILLAGILGGIAMFIWTSIAHLVLPLGEAGISEIPNESAVLSAMQSIGDQAGLYIFPGLGVGKNATRQEKNEAMKQIAAKAASGPSGLLMYHPTRPFTFGKWMGIEFGTELLEAILVVFLLAQTHIASFAGRVGFVLVAGILAAIATNVSYWNWYGFPGLYTASYMLTQIVGFFLVGIVAAFMLRKTPVRTSY